MSEHLLELSDHGLRLSSPQGIIAVTPGFASVDGDTVLYGDKASARYRLHPRESFNRFWHQLTLEPLPSPNPHFRHQADIAYGQLSELMGSLAADSDLVLSLPGHYSREQIAVLLGLMAHCPASTVGLVDQGVLAGAAAQQSPLAVILEMQLHQAVLTSLQMHDNCVTRTRIQQIPGSGLLALHDAWQSMITDAFIRQCRFDPRHTAITEQFIHDHLQDWILAALSHNEVNLEINHKGTLYQATVLRSHFEQKSRQLFTRIARELEDLDTHQLLMPATQACLPGSREWLPPHDSFAAEALVQHVFDNMLFIRENSGGNRLLTTLPAGNAATSAASHPVPRNRHLLIGHKTWAIPAGGSEILGDTLAADAALPHTVTLDCGDPLVITACPAGLELNGQPVAEGQVIRIGDRLGFAGSDLSVQVIEVG